MKYACHSNKAMKTLNRKYLICVMAEAVKIS